ncbi:MAG: hypothetical protein CMG74_08270 [Candidatus Marinimicrobia bacterium]|nr:hypothetical protein [Candidatus Neomarinimicrobiota bacterium]
MKKRFPNKNHKIISICQQKRKKNRYTIKLNNGIVFGISEDVFILKNLKVGKKFSESELDEIQNKEELFRIKNKAIRLLSYRMRSKNELFQRLKQNKYNSKKIAIVIDELEKKNYLNDKEFATLFIRDRIKNKKLGPYAIRNAIGKHNISPKVVEEIMFTVYDEFPQESLIVSIIEKRTKLKKEKNTFERKKLIDYLQRKGYQWDIIKPLLVQEGWFE